MAITKYQRNQARRDEALLRSVHLVKAPGMIWYNFQIDTRLGKGIDEDTWADISRPSDPFTGIRTTSEGKARPNVERAKARGAFVEYAPSDIGGHSPRIVNPGTKEGKIIQAAISKHRALNGRTILRKGK